MRGRFLLEFVRREAKRGGYRVPSVAPGRFAAAVFVMFLAPCARRCVERNAVRRQLAPQSLDGVVLGSAVQSKNSLERRNGIVTLQRTKLDRSPFLKRAGNAKGHPHADPHVGVDDRRERDLAPLQSSRDAEGALIWFAIVERSWIEHMARERRFATPERVTHGTPHKIGWCLKQRAER